MDFFEAQAKAKANTFKLLLLYMVSIFLLVLIFVALFVLSAYDSQQYLSFNDYLLQSKQLALGLSGVGFVIVLVITGCISLVKAWLMRRDGGVAIAEMLGGSLIDRGTSDATEKKILNVVDEMALASGAPVPPVYLMDDDSINAFAAGYSPEDAVIGVTKGAVQQLNRSELQGVIAHEFSHIFNGDMRLNMTLMATLFGLVFMALIGRVFLQIGRLGGRGNNPLAAVAVLGTLFIVVGYLGRVFGQWIKAAISRQREYLADASAVQYTRAPDSIAGALKKIGGSQDGSAIHADNADDFSHAFFASAKVSMLNRLMATHPPLEERIRRIDKHWDGQYIVPKIDSRQDGEPKVDDVTPQAEDTFATLGVAVVTFTEVMDSLGNPQEANVVAAQQLAAAIPGAIKKEIDSSLGAILAVLCLAADTDEEERSRQWIIVRKAYSESISQEAIKLYEIVSALPERLRLVTVDLAMPAMRELTREQYQVFRQTLKMFVDSDGKIELYEWLLLRLVLDQLDANYGFKRAPKIRYKDARKVQHTVEHLAALLKAIESSEGLVKEDTLKQFGGVIDTLMQCSMDIRYGALLVALNEVQSDNQISRNEADVLITLSRIFGLPIPATL